MTQLAVQHRQIDESLPISLEEIASLVREWPKNWNFVEESQRTSETSVSSSRLDQRNQELDLIQALRNGDEAAFSTLIERYHSRLLRLARAFVSSEAVAEEVVQETWLGVLEGIDGFEGRSSLRTWIFRILTNRAKTRGQRENRYVPFSDATNQTEEESDPTHEPEWFHASGHLNGHWAIPPSTWDENTPERLLLSKESLELIEKTVQRLPDAQRQIIVLHDLEGIDSEEICKGLNISPTNQRVLLHRARSKVRTVLNQYLHGR